jgi:hypothetical protein
MSGSGVPATAMVTVQIEWPEVPPVLPDNARALVTVEETTRSDEPSVVLGETLIDVLDPGRPMVAQVEVRDVDPDADLTVRVQVSDANRRAMGVEVGDLVSTQSHPVLTRGHGDVVVVRLSVVG